ncbi:MAG: hypothetical protein H6746_20085 [Deltaproteobacteria bacterium]|nr:hypothetical protein [Deltaproteobacteria bacterium]
MPQPDAAIVDLDDPRWTAPPPRGPVLVAFPSHVAELYEAATGHWGRFDECLQRLDALTAAGARVVLEHRVSPANQHALADLVRFVDDRLPDIAGLRVALPDDLGDAAAAALAPWWHAAVHAARARCVGLEATGAAGPLAADCPGLVPPPEDEPAAAPGEDLLVFATGPGHCSPAQAAADALAQLGGFARFVDPSRLTLPPEERARHIAESPRDARRMTRAAQGPPRVLVTLSAPAVSPELLRAVLAGCRALDADVTVLVPPAPGPVQPAELAEHAAVCRAAGARWAPIARIEPSPQAPPPPDCLIHLASAAPERPQPALVASLCALPSELRDAATRAWAAQLAAPAATVLEPPSVHLADDAAAWLASQGADPLVAAASGCWSVALRHTVAADLWLVEAPAPGLLLVSTDPLPIDALLARAAPAPPGTAPLLTAALAAANPYATPEGALLAGEAPPERLIAPAPAIIRRGPLVVLGLASTTLQNHAAAVLVDGRVIASVQEERLRRRKQCGWHPPGRPGVTVVSDPTLPLERAFPSRAVREVLDLAGLTPDDVDIVALNGIPARFLPTYSTSDPSRPPVTVRDGDRVFVPHHLTHAASAWRVSGMDEAFVFTVDGRGERETAAFFEAGGGELRRVFDVLCHEDSLIGGVYEFITTILGFGHHGQGSTMGLAPLGQPTIDLSRFLSARSRSDYSIHDRGILEAFGHLARARDGELTQAHVDLAASLQRALEDTVIRFIEDGLAGRPLRNLCLAGGVALNCSMNQRLRTHFGVERIFVQPGAHDAGTALGAALEAHHFVTGESPAGEMTHAYLGRGYDDAELQATLDRFRLPWTRSADLAGDVASLIADGKVVCWFQGRMELGPRALGARSILADPRRDALRDRINLLKGRQWWRPFGPSILAGREADWFETPFHSPFMLFTLPVLASRRAEVPAILHVDGTTRPQSVTAEANPLYHALLTRFERLTGVPMVINTSFNTAHEPIVESPADAIASFLDLGADVLALGPFLVDRAHLAAPRQGNSIPRFDR